MTDLATLTLTSVLSLRLRSSHRGHEAAIGCHNRSKGELEAVSKAGTLAEPSPHTVSTKRPTYVTHLLSSYSSTATLTLTSVLSIRLRSSHRGHEAAIGCHHGSKGELEAVSKAGTLAEPSPHTVTTKRPYNNPCVTDLLSG